MAQEFVKEKMGDGADARPCIFVFHGGSGSSEEDIATAVKVLVVCVPLFVLKKNNALGTLRTLVPCE